MLWGPSRLGPSVLECLNSTVQFLSSQTAAGHAPILTSEFVIPGLGVHQPERTPHEQTGCPSSLPGVPEKPSPYENAPGAFLGQGICSAGYRAYIFVKTHRTVPWEE